MSDIFDALPKSAPDEYGSWAKGKTQTLRDAFPTPEAFRAAADRFAASGGGAIDTRRTIAVLTADGDVATVNLDGLEAELARAIEEMKR